MTANEMANNLELLFDSLLEEAAPDYDDEQLSLILSKAEYKVFLDLYKVFEDDEKARQGLSQFINFASVENGTITESDTQTEVNDNGTFYDMPENFFAAISEKVKIDYFGSKTWIIVKPITHDEYMIYKDNPYRKPSDNLAWRLNISRKTNATGIDSSTPKRIELIVELSANKTFEDYKVRYLRTPIGIVVDREDDTNQVHSLIDSSYHTLIVEEARKIARGSVEDEYQISVNERNDNLN